MPKSLDEKVARILADPNCKDFILADAKDADMAFGLAAPGQSPEYHGQEGRFRTLAEYRDLMRQNVKQGLVDIMLMSASSNEQLTIKERIFENSHVTPAARANDATDVHAVMGGAYIQKPSRPFRTATIDHIMCGKLNCAPNERALGADLGLYSVTFNNDLDLDMASINAYRDFRLEAETKGFRHFLEVFDPNACANHCPTDLGRFINDQIARTLAGVVGKGRPVFLKIAYHGPAAMEALASYDRTLIPGILGGAAGTTYDAFHQLWEARSHGAKAALYGRMINNSENQPVFIEHLRWLADGQINDPADAVKSYHAALEKIGVRPTRALDEDLKQTPARAQAYGGGATAVRVDGAKKEAVKKDAKPQVDKAPATATGDFTKMTPAQKVAWNLAKWNKALREMLIVERHQRVLELLRQRNAAQLEDLARELDVSSSTIRRDLEQLEAKGLVERTHGGAIYRGERKSDSGGVAAATALAERMNEQVEAKQAIAVAAAELIQPQMTVLMDGGSTVIYAARRITARPLQVVTNSLSIANLFVDDDQVELLIIGGSLYPRTNVTVGAVATGSLADLHADLLLFSLAGIYGDEAFNQNLAMAQVEQVMLRQAARSVMLMDSSKFGRKSLARVCSLGEVNQIITDSAVDPAWPQQLGQRLTIAGPTVR